MAAVGLGFYFYSHVNDEIRQTVLRLWQDRYKDLQVTVRSAQLVDGEGVEIRGLRILDPHAAGPRGELAYFDEIVVYCQTSLTEFLKGAPEPTHILVRRPTIYATRRLDGTWSAAKILPLPHFSKIPHPITVENGAIEVFDPTSNPPSTLTLRDINVEFTPVPDHGPPSQWATDVRGYMDGDHFQRLDYSGRLDGNSSGLELNGQMTGLDLTPQLRDSLPAGLGAKLAPLAPLRGQVQLGFHVHYDPAATLPIQFTVDGELAGGRFDDSRLPYSLNDLKGHFHADNAGISIDKVSAQAGNATLEIPKATIHGYLPGSPISIQAKATNLLIGRQWDRAIPEPLATEWRRFLPSGEINVYAALDFDGQRWTPEVTVDLLDVGITYFKFPYPLEHTVGRLTLQNDELKANLTASAASQPLTITADFQHPGPRFTGYVTVYGRSIPFDQNLMVALATVPGHPDHIVRLLHPSGTFEAYMKVDRDNPDQSLRKFLQVTPNKAAVLYEPFPYPIQNITGQLVMNDDRWTFRSLHGNNGPAQINLDGSMDPTYAGGERGVDLQLNISAMNVPLQEELRECLSPQAASLWSKLQPQGTVDLPSVVVHYFSPTHSTSINVRAAPLADTCSLQLADFPYRLEKVHGQFLYKKGHIDLMHVDAVHDRTKFAADGTCDFNDDGDWNLNLSRVTANPLRADRDLITALPEPCKRKMIELNPGGTIDVDGSFDISGTRDPDVPLTKRWNLKLNVSEGSLDIGPGIRNINGVVRLKGESPTADKHEFGCYGTLNLDSMTVKDMQVTNVEGPIFCDEKRIVLGKFADPKGRLIGQLFGGRLEAWGGIEQADPARSGVAQYQLFLALGLDEHDGIDHTADIKQMALQFGGNRSRLDGRLLGIVQLQNMQALPNGQRVSTGPGIHGLRGQANVQLLNADIYELPFMVSLLKVLSIHVPDQTAFTKCVIDARIEGDHVYPNIDFVGDLLSLRGAGDVGFDGKIDLTFRAIPGRSDLQPRGLTNFFAATSKEFVQIHVGGTLVDPQIDRRILPGVDRAIHEVQSGVRSIDTPITR